MKITVILSMTVAPVLVGCTSTGDLDTDSLAVLVSIASAGVLGYYAAENGYDFSNTAYSSTYAYEEPSSYRVYDEVTECYGAGPGTFDPLLLRDAEKYASGLCEYGDLDRNTIFRAKSGYNFGVDIFCAEGQFVSFYPNGVLTGCEIYRETAFRAEDGVDYKCSVGMSVGISENETVNGCY